MSAAVDQQVNRPKDGAKAVEEVLPFEELLEQMRAGSQEAAQKIVETYGPHIRAAVKRRFGGVLRPIFDSEDFVQSAWKSLICMSPEKIDEIHRPQQLVGLLAAIAARKMIDQYRHRTCKAMDETRRVPLHHPEVLEMLARIAGINTPSQICIAREKYDFYRRRWEEYVGRQTDRDRRIIHLRLGGAEFADIAQTEEISERQARRIVNKLFARLSEAGRAA